ncbi:MAG: O-antigen ligase family protein [Anaerolineales bacterium]
MPTSKPVDFLAHIELVSVTLMVAASLVDTNLLPAAVGVAFFFWPFRLLVRRISTGRWSLSVRTTADLPVLLLLGMMPVTMWVTTQPEVTLQQVYRLLTGVALFYVIVNWAVRGQRIRWLEMSVITAGILLAAFATISVRWATTKIPFLPDEVYQRFTILVTDTVHPNVLAGSLVLFLPVALAALLFGWRQVNWLHRLLSVVGLVTISAMLAISQSRGAMVAVGVSVLAMLILRWRQAWIVLVPAAFSAGLGIYRLGFMPILEALTGNDTLGSLENRLEIWSRALYMVQDFPFTGVGMGSFTQAADLLYPFFYIAPGRVHHAHNLFLQVAVDLGLLGLLAWLAIFFLAIACAVRIYRIGLWRQDGWLAGSGAWLLCSQIALGVHGLTDAVTWGMVRPAPFVWILWGIVFGLYNWVMQSDSSTPDGYASENPMRTN